MSVYLRKYGAATTVDFALYKLDGTGLKTDAASATGDITLYRDEAGVETLDADAFVDEGAIYSLAISQAEMTASRIIIAIVDQSSPQVWLDKTLIVETYGHASAQHPFDLGTDKIGTIVNTGGTATIGAVLGDMANSAVVTRFGNVQTEVNKIGTVANSGGTATLGAVLGDMANSAVVTRLANAQTELNKIGTITNTGGTATIGAALGDVANSTVAARLTTIGGYLDTEIAAILADTNELQTDWVNGGRLDLLIDAIKASTDLLTLAAIADAVHDEAVEGTTTLRQSMRLIGSVLYGELSGGGTNTLVYNDIGDTKPRITATVDASFNRTAIVKDAT
jgi:hypothetical protein